tara:strand:+ start:2087 stop:2935 length:849 start_codon:yes stop_codon:yes gene_type:complete
MIFWIASYPKSGNTWLRTLISSYYYSNDGFYTQELIKQIGQFPEKKYFESFEYDPKSVIGTSNFWIKAQEKINRDKKLRFFKTHNVFGKINNNPFTSKENSIGCIYIVRDPRNVITSLSNHYELDYEKSLEWMTNHKKYIYDNRGENDYGNFQFISSWSNNYKSWKIQRDVPVKIVRYEDLLEKTYEVTKDIIGFINKTSKTQVKIDIKKLKNSVNSTLFVKLKKLEKNNGFSEAIFSKKKNKMIPFFNLGPDNNWEKILNKSFADKLCNIFAKDLLELGYK